jgi:hypothetical protein
MKNIARHLICLYPSNWRDRYGEEFAALLEDSKPGISGVFDLIKGAIRMRVTLPSFPKLALVLSIFGLLAGLGVSYLVTPRYVSSATMMFNQPSGYPPINLLQVAEGIRGETFSRTSLTSIITDPRLDLYHSERTRIPLLDVIEQMRMDLEIRIIPAGPAIDIKFRYSDRMKARDTVQAVVAKLLEANFQRQRAPVYVKRQRSFDQIDRMEARIAALEKRLGIPPSPPEPLEFEPTMATAGLDVIDVPSLATKPVFPDRFRFMSVGFGSGFVLALVIAIFRHRSQPAIPFPATTA